MGRREQKAFGVHRAGVRSLRGRNRLGLLTKAEQAEEGSLSLNHLCEGRD